MSFYAKNEQQLCIPIESSSVHFLQSPDKFYEEFLEKRISTSKKRIIISALYLGTGQKEQTIIAELKNVMEGNDQLNVAILLDYFRGMRNDPQNKSSVSILRPLTTDKNNFMVYLFHTPEMRGFLKSLLPERINEIIGLQHMKFIIFDNSIIVSWYFLMNYSISILSH